jgi:hypothetical protein
MLSTMKVTLAALVMGVGMLAAGCESSGSANGGKHDHSTMAATGDGQAVACDKCKVTWRQVPERGGKGRIVGYRTSKSHECPECRSAAENFFSTGKLEHTCKTCGDNALEVCKMH